MSPPLEKASELKQIIHNHLQKVSDLSSFNFDAIYSKSNYGYMNVLMNAWCTPFFKEVWQNWRSKRNYLFFCQMGKHDAL